MTDLTTLDALKSELKREDEEFDNLFASWIQQASAAIVDICEQPIVSATVTHEFAGADKKTKNIGYHPAVLTALVVKKSVSDDWEAVADGYEMRTPNGIPRIHCAGTLNSAYTYRATLTVGYAANAIPAPVERACIVACREYYKQSPIGDDRAGIQSRGEGNQYGNISTSFVSELPEVMRLLRPYKILPV